jgi:hypothetical protein
MAVGCGVDVAFELSFLFPVANKKAQGEHLFTQRIRMKGSFFRSLSWIAMIHCVRSFHVLSKTNRVSLSTSLSLRSSLLPRIQQPQFSWRLLSTASEASEEKKRVVFVGTPEVAATSLKSLYENSLQDGSYEIVSVITQPPKRRKRNGKLEHSPVGKVAEEIGLPILCPEKVRRMFSPSKQLCTVSFSAILLN